MQLTFVILFFYLNANFPQRYNVLLSEQEKIDAKNHIIETWEQDKGLKQANPAPTPPASAVTPASRPTSTAETSSELNDDPVEIMLREKESSVRTVAPTVDKRKLESVLDEFLLQERVPQKTNVLSYWNDNRGVNSELFSLSQIVLALPVTQVSVERSFSGLRFILSELRSNLAPDILENILLIRANHKFSQ